MNAKPEFRAMKSNRCYDGGNDFEHFKLDILDIMEGDDR